LRKEIAFLKKVQNSVFFDAIRFLEKRNIEFYIVGGAIRDFLRGKENIKDLDIIIPFDPEKIIYEIAKKTGGTPFLLDEKRKEWRIVIKSEYTLDIGEIEIDIEHDLSERDFSINAIAFKFPENFFIDKFNGFYDIEKKIVRAFKKENLIKDPLRILRAFRFMATLGFEIEKETFKFIKENREKILDSAKERIMREIYIMFSQGIRIYSTLLKMRESKVLFTLIPELKELDGCLQIYNNRTLDILSHTLNSLKYLENFYKNWRKTFFKEYEKEINRIFDPQGRVLLFISLIFHDIAKPLTRKIENGKTKFHGHDKIGANIAYNWAKRMRFSERFAKRLKEMVFWHMYPHLLGKEEELTKRALFRYLRKTEEIWFLLFVQAYADFRATPPGKNPSYLKNLLRKIYDFKIEIEREKPKPLINGYDLIALGLKPGPIFKKILTEIEELKAEDVLKTKEEALNFVKEKYIIKGNMQKG